MADKANSVAPGSIMAGSIGEDCAVGEILAKTSFGWRCASLEAMHGWYAWTWMSGSTVPNQNGVYGTEGTPDPANVPGSRSNAVSWTDASGNFWLFGGWGYPESGGTDHLNDLWKCDGTNWTWMSGSNATYQNGVYGTKGTSDPANVPGSRNAAVSWTDASGNLWLFGGSGYAASGSGRLNDLWTWDGTNWTWMSGSNMSNQNGVYGTKGMPDPANVPGSRYAAVSWIDSSGSLWLFGGYGLDVIGSSNYLNDLWTWDGTNWTWMSGSNVINQNGVYGSEGTPDPANVPGSRYLAVSWTDSSGKFWLFGGQGFPASGSIGYLNDLWRWDGSDWSWMSGSDKIDQNGVYGTKGTPDPANVPGSRSNAVSWTDSSGSMWLFGGYGYPASGSYAYLNDLWRWDGSDWVWMSGSNVADQNGVYGTKGALDPANVPGSRYRRAVSWTDSSGSMWLFGGVGYDASGGFGFLNDLWKYK
jgi:N-acetylneuraminic acid mutarotase